jgi:hypothetical protein
MREYLPEKDSARRSALRTSCPTCGALADRPCIGPRGNIRVAIHADRYAKARGERTA